MVTRVLSQTSYQLGIFKIVYSMSVIMAVLASKKRERIEISNDCGF
jgi:hypothetical protein